VTVVTASSSLLPVNRTLGVVLVVLLVAAIGIAAYARLADENEKYSRGIATAGVRAAIQLAVVSALIGWVVHHVAALLGFVALMYGVASWTAGRRVTRNATWRWAAVPVGVGSLPVVVLLVVTGLVPVNGLALIPVAGILIGGGLTGTVLGGRRALEELTGRAGEVEAAMALGFTDRDARMEIARPAASGAMIPALDQTRTVGLVTLPGAFVGLLLGGSSPVTAGAVQLFVLIALMAVQALSIAVVLELIARGRITRVAPEPAGPPARRPGRLSLSRARR
jgi:putative ABC transport system permease protein